MKKTIISVAQYFSLKSTIISLFVISSSIILSGCIPQANVPNEQSSNSQVIDEQNQVGDENQVVQEQSSTVIAPEIFVLTAEEDGVTAQELLEENASVQTKSFGEAGEFIESINGLTGNEKSYWAFYVNDEYAMQAANKTILKKGDVVKFVYTPVDDSTMEKLE